LKPGIVSAVRQKFSTFAGFRHFCPFHMSRLSCWDKMSFTVLWYLLDEMAGAGQAYGLSCFLSESLMLL